MNFRTEHPRPDLYREDWITLNGVWDFEIDTARTGVSRGFEKRESLNRKINVPFCPESELSGIRHTDFMEAVWYRREFELPESFATKRVLIHFGAADYFTRVYINSKPVGTHKGGFTPFSFDITDYLTEGKNSVTVYCEDDHRTGCEVTGKQSHALVPHGCYYTRTTGIWQSVWLEAVRDERIVRYNTQADIEGRCATVTVDCTEAALGCMLSCRVSFAGEVVGEASVKLLSSRQSFAVKLDKLFVWDIGQGNLYDMELTVLKNGVPTDTLCGYFGMREVALRGDSIFLNGRPVFGRFVLDQGFYPDGLYTAPADEALVYDIEAAMSLGFNGARLHQKVFEPRFLYHADRLGYMLFGECGNWGLDHTDKTNIYNFLPEWIEEMERDMAHPSIIGWCPFNETWDLDGRRQSNEMLDVVYNVTKSLDPTRIVVTNSGSYPCKSDLYDVHDYEQDPEKFREYYSHIGEGIVKCQLYRQDPVRQHYDGKQAIFVSEYGGIKWAPESADGDAWGYGNSVSTEQEFLDRLEGLTDVLLEARGVMGFCYTQLYDIESEQNGLLTYGRKFKFPIEKIHAIISKKSHLDS